MADPIDPDVAELMRLRAASTATSPPPAPTTQTAGNVDPDVAMLQALRANVPQSTVNTPTQPASGPRAPGGDQSLYFGNGNPDNYQGAKGFVDLLYDNILGASNAGVHHGMSFLHGAANLGQNALASSAEHYFPESYFAKSLRAQADEDKATTQKWENDYQLETPNTPGTMFGAIAGEIGPALAAPQIRLTQGTTLVPRVINGAANGAAYNTIVKQNSVDSNVQKDAGVGAGIGAAAAALLPPIVQKVATLGQKGANYLDSLVSRSADDVAPAVANAADASANVATKARYKLNTDGTIVPVENSPIPQFETQVPKLTPPPVTAESGVLPQGQQFDRLRTLRAIGLDSTRPSTVAGDKFQSGIEYQTSKLDNQSGQVMRDQLAKEQAALNNYGNKIVSDAGGAPDASQTIRGQSILQPLQGLSNWFDNRIGGLYTAAKTKAGALGAVQPDNLNSLVGNPDFRERLLSSQDGTALLGSIDRQLGRFNSLPSSNGAAPNTVQSAENLRQFFNSVWTPQNSGTIGALKQALDMDVAKVGGADVFTQARQLHALRSNTLDNPNGIASLLTESGPDGINRAVPIEKVASKVTSMPDAQFGHIVDTLNGNMPPEVTPQAQQALREIKAQLTDQLVSAGRGNGQSQWSATNFNKEFGKLQGKLGKVFSPEELANIKNLHDAGYILGTPTAYPGAAAQNYNFMQQGVLTGLPAGGAVLGSTLGGGPGAAIGSAIGGATAGLAKKAMDASNAQRLADVLRDPLSANPNTPNVTPSIIAIIDALRKWQPQNYQGQ